MTRVYREEDEDIKRAILFDAFKVLANTRSKLVYSSKNIDTNRSKHHSKIIQTKKLDRRPRTTTTKSETDGRTIAKDHARSK